MTSCAMPPARGTTPIRMARKGGTPIGQRERDDDVETGEHADHALTQGEVVVHAEARVAKATPIVDGGSNGHARRPRGLRPRRAGRSGPLQAVEPSSRRARPRWGAAWGAGGRPHSRDSSGIDLKNSEPARLARCALGRECQHRPGGLTAHHAWRIDRILVARSNTPATTLDEPRFRRKPVRCVVPRLNQPKSGRRRHERHPNIPEFGVFARGASERMLVRARRREGLFPVVLEAWSGWTVG